MLFYESVHVYKSIILKMQTTLYVTLPQQREKIRFLLQSIKNCKFAFKINLNSELRITAK